MYFDWKMVIVKFYTINPYPAKRSPRGVVDKRYAL